MQSVKMILCALLLLAAMPAHAEPMEFGTFKDYLTRLKKKEVNPLDTYIQGKDEKNITIRELADGRPVLLHFWATWCLPCIAEMPSLAELAEEMKDEPVFILALSEDFGGIRKVEDFYARHKITSLVPYVDVMTGTANLMDVDALPVTVLLDVDGGVLDRVTGVVHWKDEDTRQKIRNLASIAKTQDNADNKDEDDASDAAVDGDAPVPAPEDVPQQNSSSNAAE